MNAAENGHTQIVKLLLEQKEIDIYETDVPFSYLMSFKESSNFKSMFGVFSNHLIKRSSMLHWKDMSML